MRSFSSLMLTLAKLLLLVTVTGIADKALAQCIAQIVKDRGVQNSTQLTQINCSKAGISSLKGIGQFTQLAYLDVSYNRIYDTTPLLGLSKLSQVKLKGNKQLNCAYVKELLKSIGKVEAPQCVALQSL